MEYQKRFTKLDIGLSDITKASATLESHTPRTPRAVPPKKIRKLEKPDDTTSSSQSAELGTLANKPARLDSPWLYFQRSSIEVLDLGGKVSIARTKAPASALVGIRKYPVDKAKEILPKSRKLRHLNIVRVLDAFVTKESLYLVFEDMRLSLEHFVISPAYPTSLQLGTILGQVSMQRPAPQALHSRDARSWMV